MGATNAVPRGAAIDAIWDNMEREARRPFQTKKCLNGHLK